MANAGGVRNSLSSEFAILPGATAIPNPGFEQYHRSGDFRLALRQHVVLVAEDTSQLSNECLRRRRDRPTEAGAVRATDEGAMRTISRRLPARYQILPASIDFRIPGFEQYCMPGNRTLALRQRECAAWFDEFVDVVVESCGRRFLPICRLSDGEFLFLLGPQPPVSWQPPLRRWGGHVLALWRRYQARRGFSAYTQGHYHSGSYSRTEWDRGRPEYSNMLQKLSRNGILALHLSYSEKPFQERYFPAFAKWLDENLIELNDHNYYPFYFVYAMLSGPRRRDVFAGRRILVVNGTPEPKRSRIIDGLLCEGVEEVTWLGISSDRSLYDRIDLSVASRRLDLALVGAGIGKPNILLQLEPLGIPCIDAGYMFEVWANSENGHARPFCKPSAGTMSPYASRGNWNVKKRVESS